MLEQAVVVPVKVEICAPITYHHYTTNYIGPARKAGQEGALQVPATVLTDVCYRIYARAYHDDRPIPYSSRGKQGGTRCTHGGHAYRDIFNRRIERGQCYRTPSLGWKEFPVNYFGAFREQTKVQTDINLIIPCLFKSFSNDGLGKATKWQPTFMNNVEVRAGVLHYVCGSIAWVITGWWSRSTKKPYSFLSCALATGARCTADTEAEDVGSRPQPGKKPPPFGFALRKSLGLKHPLVGLLLPIVALLSQFFGVIFDFLKEPFGRVQFAPDLIEFLVFFALNLPRKFRQISAIRLHPRADKRIDAMQFRRVHLPLPKCVLSC